MMNNQPKQVRKNKEQLLDEVRTNQKVDKQKKMIRELLALAPNLSIYDFGNHLDVVAGLILQAQKRMTNELLVSSLDIDLRVKDAPNPELIQSIFDIVKDEKAPDEVSALLAKVNDHIKYQIKEVAFIEKKVSDIGVEEMLK